MVGLNLLRFPTLERQQQSRRRWLFIGAGLDRQAITAALDAALMPVSDFTPEAWAALPDPFPKWGRKAA